jgi:tRNA pseudouridine38-40 synthase
MFTVSGEINIPLEKLPLALNTRLPDDIKVFHAERAGEDFHVIFDAKRKTYMYKIYNAPIMNPLLVNYACHEPTELDVNAMRKAAEHFIGTHDFAAFRATGSSAKTTVRTVFSLDVTRNQSLIEIIVTGGGFLYNMVRIIAGTLMYAGLGKILPDDIPLIIMSGDRAKAGKTAPACGLVLVGVEY